MRFIVTYKSRNDNDNAKPGYMVTYRSVMAESAAEAVRAFNAAHPNDLAVEAVAVPDDPKESMQRYGWGAWTDDELAEHRKMFNAKMDARKVEDDGIRERLLTYEPDEFAAEIDYQERRENETTQNAEGVHIGDIFECSWGYDQTNRDFYQVVDLRGAHTAILAHNCALSETNSGMTGYARPIRDCFKRETRYTVRTRISTYDGNVTMNAPEYEGESLWPVTFGKLYEISDYA